MSKVLLGDVLKRLIKENGLTQREFAKMIYVTEGTMSNYVNNKTSPPYETCVFIGVIFGVSVDYLLGREYVSGTLCELNNEEYLLIEMLRGSDIRTRRDIIRKLIFFDKNKKKE